MALSPWAAAEAARLHHADLLGAAEEHRRVRALRGRAARTPARPRRWPGVADLLARRLAPR